MAKYLSRLHPVGMLLFVALISQTPNILAWVKPNTYWVDLWVPNANRDLAPFVAGLLVVLPIVWLVYRPRRSRTMLEKLSESTLTFFLIDFAQVVVGLLLLPYICVHVAAYSFFHIPGPYHLDSLTYDDHQYNVLLDPGFNDIAIIVYDCNLNGEQCQESLVHKRIDPADNLWDVTLYGAYLGVEDHTPFLCIRDRVDVIALRTEPRDSIPWVPYYNSTVCQNKFPTSVPSSVGH